MGKIKLQQGNNQGVRVSDDLEGPGSQKEGNKINGKLMMTDVDKRLSASHSPNEGAIRVSFQETRRCYSSGHITERRLIKSLKAQCLGDHGNVLKYMENI